MAREIVDLEGIGKLFCLSRWQIYKLVRRPVDPLPARKCGRLYRFDVQKCLAWFDHQPGRDSDDLGGEL